MERTRRREGEQRRVPRTITEPICSEMNFSPLFPPSPFPGPLPTLSFVDLRPKGRGRPQRILLGVWPDEHIRGVIRAVVFRDGHSPHIVKEEPTTMYPSLANYAACNGPEGAVSPGAAAAAAVAAVAQGNGSTNFAFFSFSSRFVPSRDRRPTLYIRDGRDI